MQRGGRYAYDDPPEPAGVQSAGTVHHVAWASTMEDHEAWQERLKQAGAPVTPVIDRFYFRSIYFREPSGVLFEIATLGPGFATDEDPEHLGERLSLPPNYERYRDQVERTLTPIENPRERWAERQYGALRQLTSVDAQFLALETARQSGHVGGLAILDSSTRPDGKLTLRAVHDLIAERLPLLPPLRWRLAEVPFGLDYPYWVDDSDFDLDFHVRELALSPPGNEEQLAEQVARIFARPLDRARPLWELYLVHGLGANRAAVLTKIHHSLVDGLSGAEIMGVLLDLTPEGRDAPPPLDGAGDGEPGELEMLGRGLLGLPRYPLRLLRALPAALPNLDETAFSTLPGTGVAARVAGRVGQALDQGRGRPPRAHEPQGAAHAASTAASRRTGASRSGGSRSRPSSG